MTRQSESYKFRCTGETSIHRLQLKQNREELRLWEIRQRKTTPSSDRHRDPIIQFPVTSHGGGVNGLRRKKSSNGNRDHHKEEEKPKMQPTEPAQPQSQQMKSLSFSSQMSREDEEMARSALSAFRAKEDEIEKRKMEVRERVKAQLGRVEEETRRLANIREELETMADPMRKEVSLVRKKIDSVNKELKPLGATVQKKEREYKEALDTFNEKNREKVQLITKLMEMGQLVGESEKLRLKKLEELSKSIETE
ncbi:hypothetical protein HID58_071094 [Brassica napus]|uniref:RAB6-interacting golgin n=2 Tax=Brassica TaxID=3705 RepID=A0ABQ7Z0L1_BRANA|nr:hypothetical protein HID58_071094 [Brassica napus]